MYGGLPDKGRSICAGRLQIEQHTRHFYRNMAQHLGLLFADLQGFQTALESKARCTEKVYPVAHIQVIPVKIPLSVFLTDCGNTIIDKTRY